MPRVSNAMDANERRRKIIAYVDQAKRVTVTELCREFNVSSATVRNDLNQLYEEGLLKRIHGGALANIQANFDPITKIKEAQFLKEKQIMAQEALPFIHEGDTIALDAGTTILEVAKLLGSFEKLRVLTYDLNIAGWLDANTGVQLYLAGGEVRQGHHYLIGSAPIDAFSSLNVDVFVMACNGIDIKAGVTTPQLDTALIKRQILANAGKKVLLADSSKVGHVTFAKFANVSDIDVFITDNYADSRLLDQFRNAGVDVRVADVHDADRAGNPDEES